MTNNANSDRFVVGIHVKRDDGHLLGPDGVASVPMVAIFVASLSAGSDPRSDQSPDDEFKFTLPLARAAALVNEINSALRAT